MDLDALIRRLLDRNIDMIRQITAEELLLLTRMAREMFQSQPVFLELLPPVVVCGDTHGQFDDLLRIFHQLGFPPNTNYLFLGDYVDRGPLSLETISLLFCFKLKYPGNIFLLRGNHETASTNEMYGFQHEIDQRYGRSDLCLWKAYNEAFAQMPISALIGERILCMHGGLSPYLRELDDLRKIKRGWINPRELSLEMDLLWSDPEPNTSGWHQNTRGCSYTFGVDELTKAIALLDVDLVVRAHQVVQDGYEFEPETRKLITIFSAPNYCGEFDNCGAVMYVDQKLCCSFIQFRPIQ